MQRIERIESAGPAKRARRIYFVGDSSCVTTASTVVKRLGIAVGDEVDRVALEQLITAEELPLAKERAIQLLRYRERSVHELRCRLKDSGFPQSICDAVVARFTEVQLVDDERFASAWIRSRRASGYGDRRIRRELTEKGIDPDLMSVLLESCEQGTDVERAVATLKGRTLKATELERHMRRLVGRGFSYHTARAALDSIMGGQADSDLAHEDGDTVDDLH